MTLSECSPDFNCKYSSSGELVRGESPRSGYLHVRAVQSADPDLRPIDPLQARLLPQLRQRCHRQALPKMQRPLLQDRTVSPRDRLHLHLRRRKTNAKGLQKNLSESEGFERPHIASSQAEIFLLFYLRVCSGRAVCTSAC